MNGSVGGTHVYGTDAAPHGQYGRILWEFGDVLPGIVKPDHHHNPILLGLNVFSGHPRHVQSNLGPQKRRQIFPFLVGEYDQYPAAPGAGPIPIGQILKAGLAEFPQLGLVKIADANGPLQGIGSKEFVDHAQILVDLVCGGWNIKQGGSQKAQSKGLRIDIGWQIAVGKELLALPIVFHLVALVVVVLVVQFEFEPFQRVLQQFGRFFLGDAMDAVNLFLKIVSVLQRKFHNLGLQKTFGIVEHGAGAIIDALSSSSSIAGHRKIVLVSHHEDISFTKKVRVCSARMLQYCTLRLKTKWIGNEPEASSEFCATVDNHHHLISSIKRFVSNCFLNS